MSKPTHHMRQDVCSTRAPYRDGRKPTAVKVYTIHHESKYLLIQGVPALGTSTQLVKLFEAHGDIEEHRILDDYPGEQFAEVHLIKYKRIQSARFSKRKLDDWSFYGGVLHICYAPEYETIQETRDKLRERRRVVEKKTRQYKIDGTYSSSLSQAENSSAETDKTQDRISPTHDTYNNIINTGESEHTVAVSHSGNVQSVQNSDQPAFNSPEVQDYGVPVLPRQNTLPNVSYNENYQQYGGQTVPSQQTEHTYDDHNIQHYGVPGRPETSQYHHGNTEIYGRQAEPFQKPLSYGEQVVQQARSLQHYGQNIFKTHEIGNKRPNSDDLSSTKNKLIQNVGEFEEDQLFLPPPPKQTKTSMSGFSRSQKYGAAKVPSAQATFPADFDARIKRDPVQTDKVGTKPNLIEEPSDLESDEHQTVGNQKANSLKKNMEKTMQEKVEENLKNKNIVIKDFSKKGTVPRFIPRQAQVKNKSEKIQKNGTKSSDIMNRANELNQEIKKNAFQLGRAQGPADLGPSISNESLDPKDKSVMDSILNIRKTIINATRQARE